MGWSNPPIPWGELERRLSAAGPQHADGATDDGPVTRQHGPTGRRRRCGHPTSRSRRTPSCTATATSASSTGPADRTRWSRRRSGSGLHGLALTDHDGFAGAPLFAETAQKPDTPAGPRRPVYGAELSLGLTAPQNGVPDPEGSHLLVLAEGSRATTGWPRRSPTRSCAVTRRGGRSTTSRSCPTQGRGHWLVLTGCRKGAVRSRARRAAGVEAAAAELDRLTALFGHDRVVVELRRPRPPARPRGQRRARRARASPRPAAWSRPTTCTTRRPAEHRLADAMAAVRARRSLAEMDGWLPPSGAASLRSGEEMAQRFARYPGAVARTVELADQLAFDLQKATPRLPKHRHPRRAHPDELAAGAGRAKASRPTTAGSRTRPRRASGSSTSCGSSRRRTSPATSRSCTTSSRSPASRGILCQGRGSAASSAVCYALRHHRDRRGRSTTCRSSGSSPRTATRSPTSTSTSTPTGARR